MTTKVIVMRRLFFLRIWFFCTAPFLSIPVFATEQDCIEKHSQAWCLLDLVGLSKGAKEIPASKIQEFLDKNKLKLNPGENSINKDDLVMSGLNFLDTGILSGFFSAGFLFLAFNNNAPPGASMQFFVILPKSKVQNDDAAMTAEKALLNGIIKQLKIDSPVSLKEYDHKNFFGIEKRREYSFSNEICGIEGCEYRSNFLLTGGVTRDIVFNETPEWASGELVHTWRSFFPVVKNKTTSKTDILKISDYPGLMSNLPNWFYLYQPGEVPFIMNSEGLKFLIKK